MHSALAMMSPMNKWASLILADFEFSEQVKAEWGDPMMYDKLKAGKPFINPSVDLQVQV